MLHRAPLPGWLIFDAASRTFSGTPENIHVGSLTVRVTALDKAGASMKNDFMITVVNVNDAPVVLNSIDDQTVIEGNFFSIEIPSIFSDIDGDTLSYEVIRLNFPSLPTWLTYNADTRMLSGTPTSITEFTVRVTANDGNGGSVFEDFKLSVVPLNYRARLDNPIADQTVTVNVLYSFEVPANTFSDQDGDPLTYVAKKPNGTLLPDWLDFDPDTRTFSGTPSTSDMGTVTVSLRASDGNGEWAVDEFNIIVTGN
jgi:hypothetical protein